MLITLVEAAQLMGRLSEIRSNPKREANWLWERLRRREQRREAGLPPDPADPYQNFPARKDGRRWMVHREQLIEWLRQTFGGEAA